MSHTSRGAGTATIRPGAFSRGRFHRVLDLPELHVVIFAFLLNFVWEFLQTPFFESLPQMPHWKAVKVCTFATLGDVAIMLISFWCVAAAARTRWWIVNPNWRQLAGFAGLGIAITIALELAALSTGRWGYSSSMPVIPLLGVGFLPLAQWLVLPLLTAWFVRRQLT